MAGASPVRPLVTKSIEVIVDGQAGTGAYLAASGYRTYGFSWIRDGSFIAASMDAHGRRASAGAFHLWVARTVERYAHKVDRLAAELDLALAGTGDPLRPLDDRYVLHTRFTADGDEADEHWGNFQLDGYGFWLTSVLRHFTMGDEDLGSVRPAIDLVSRYLAMTWRSACFDCWEEYPTRRHMTTWAAIARGLRESEAAGIGPAGIAAEIEASLLEAIGEASIMRKMVPADDRLLAPVETSASGAAIAGHERVGRPLPPASTDGSALLVLGDFGPFDPAGDVVRNTLAAIEDHLVVGGGVHRYLEDEYYGGGLWVVLAGALATIWAPLDAGRATAVLDWIENQADATLALPEQVTTHMRYPSAKRDWVERWGYPAQPLLWSHAMYLLGVTALT